MPQIVKIKVMKTSNEFKMNKVVNYVNNNIDELKQELNKEINWWNTNQDDVVNNIGFDTLDTWIEFCYTSISEYVLTKTGFAYMSSEKYRFVLLNKIEELISK